MLEEGEANELYEVFIRRIADKLYPIADKDGSDYEQDRYEHRDLAGWSRTDVQHDLEALRIRRRLLDHPWLEKREVALQNQLPQPRARAVKATPRPRRSKR